jgi:hypothetical protein
MIGLSDNRGNLKAQKLVLALEKWIVQSIVALWTSDKIIFRVGLAEDRPINPKILINILGKAIFKEYSHNLKKNMHNRHDLQDTVTSLKLKANAILTILSQSKN